MLLFLLAVVGGLLSAHLMTRRANMVQEPGWPCSGPLLRLAEKAARKLLPGMGIYHGFVEFHGIFYNSAKI